MKTIQISTSVACASVVLLAGCSDPSSGVHQAGAGDAAEAPEAAESAKHYTIQDGSTIGFVGSKVTGSHDGGFNEFSGTIVTVGGQPAAGTEITINMDSTWSDSDRLTGHLKGADFFNVAEHPESKFVITTIESAGDAFNVTGNLDLHGVTKSISFPATVTVTEVNVTVIAEFAINRKDFNIVYAGKPDDLIRDNVVIKLNVTGTGDGA